MQARHQRRRHAGRTGARDEEIDFAWLVHVVWVRRYLFER
jgi:hypothetical protein